MAAKERLRALQPPPERHWGDYSDSGARWARHSEIEWLDSILSSREWREKDIATALENNSLLEGVFNSREAWHLRMQWLRKMMEALAEDFWNAGKTVSFMVALNLSERSVIELRNMLAKR